jgi:serine/threonine protein kinase
MVPTALLLLACLAALAAAASQPEISWRGGRTEFELVQNTPLRSGRRAGFDNGKFSAKQCHSNQAANKRPALTLHDVYDVYGVVGNGMPAKVRQGIHRISKKTYAIKTIDLSRIRADQRELLRREANIMRTLDQHDMIRICETYEEEDKLHLVLELCEGADVLEHTVALELFEYIIMKTSVLYSPQLVTSENRQAGPSPGRS